MGQIQTFKLSILKKIKYWIFFSVSLFLYREGRLSKQQIGAFLGGHNEFNQSVLSEFVSLHEFTHLILVQALRQFLWSFRYACTVVKFIFFVQNY